jgi:hypothetical protein
MNSTGLGDLEPETAADASANRVQPVSTDDAAHPDPITGEPGAHPVGVGVGALGAGAAGAVIGAVLGPIGAAIGLAFGAVAGGLAGKEVATTSEAPGTISDGTVEPLPSSYEVGNVPATAEGETHSISDTSSPLTTDPQAGEMVYDLTHEDKPFSASPLPGDELLPSHVPPSKKESETFFTNTDSNPIHESEPRPLTQTEPPFGLHDAPAFKVEPGGDSSVENIYVKDLDSEESIRTTAYYKYLGRVQSGQSGDELADWVEAEEEVVGH